MKVLSGLLLFVLLGAYSYAQQDAKIVAEIAAGNEKTITNAPFSAEAKSESIQVLADGNRIVRSSTTKLYRNSEGQFRREITGGSGGLFGTFYTFGQGISILDPVSAKRFTLDLDGKTARVVELRNGKGVSIAGSIAPAKIVGKQELTERQRVEIEAKIASDKNLTDEQLVRAKKKLAEAQAVQSAAIAAPRIAPITAWPVQAPGAYSVTMGEGFTGFFPGQHPKYEMQSEDLGTRDFGGVLAEGRRSITTIPAAAIGNERPIEITYERWYSKELELVVYSKHSDPRFGDQTYTLTNIVRSEPDPSLFTVPTGFKLVTEPGFVYKLSTKPAMTTTPRPAVAPKPPTAVTVKSTIP